METQTLFKISLAISITGIFFLLFLANFLEPKLISINEINYKMLNEKVKISGEIEKIEDKETFKILSLKDETGKIDVLCECESINGTIRNYQEIMVIGKVQEYGKYLQIQADKITRWPTN